MSETNGPSPSTRSVETGDVHTDVAAVLLAHARAADAELLAACRSLLPDQLDRGFEMGPGTIRKALTHNLGAMRLWADVYAERAERPWIADEGPFTVARLEALVSESHDDWADLASRLPLGQLLQRTWGENTRRFTRAHILVHVTTHSVHHRAQIINMLRHLGVEQRPTGSVMSWVISMVTDSNPPAPTPTR